MGGKVTKKIKEKLGIIQTCTYLTLTAKGYVILFNSNRDDSYGNLTHCNTVQNIVEIWIENFQCFALDISGNLYSWGLNDYCQLGNGNADNYVFPKEEEKYCFVNNLAIINLSRGFISEKVFREQNPLYLKYIKKISCGDGFTVCLDRDGIVYTWGKNSRGQLGYEMQYDDATIVSGVKCQANPRVVSSLQERKFVITDIICGGDFTFAVDEQGQNFSWGNNDHHQLARKTDRTVEFTPEVADSLAQLEKISKICCGWMHGCCLTEVGEVYMWGNPYFDYDKKVSDLIEPSKVDLPSRAVDLSSGFHHFCAIVSEDYNYELFTWGANEYGQCGLKLKKDRILVLTPTKISFSNEMKIMQVYCGPFHTICLLTGGKLYAFGHNFNKELGDYSATSVDRPVEFGWSLKGGEGYKIKNIFCGNGFTVIVQVPSDSNIFYDNTDHVQGNEYSKVRGKTEYDEQKLREMVNLKNKEENENL